MFSIRKIRAQARQTINSTPGMFLLPAIPVAITLFLNIIQFFRPDVLGVASMGYNQTTAIELAIFTIIFSILFGLLSGLINLSINYAVFQVVKGTKQRTTATDAVSIFGSPHLGKIFPTFLLKHFFLFLWGIVSYLGIMLFFIGSISVIYYSLILGTSDPTSESILGTLGIFIIFGLILMIGGIALYIPQALAYSQVEYILFEQLEKNQYAGASAIIKESRQMMKGYKGKRFVLDLSFIGWYILVSITFGLSGIYVIPYYSAAQAHFFQALKEGIQERQASYFNQLNPTNQSAPTAFDSDHGSQYDESIDSKL